MTVGGLVHRCVGAAETTLNSSSVPDIGKLFQDCSHFPSCVRSILGSVRTQVPSKVFDILRVQGPGSLFLAILYDSHPFNLTL